MQLLLLYLKKNLFVNDARLREVGFFKIATEI